MSNVHVGDLGSYVTVQLGYRSLTRSGSACFAFWLAGSGGPATVQLLTPPPHPALPATPKSLKGKRSSCTTS